jgi:anaerobic ribonucleoside-triphosphate reductase
LIEELGKKEIDHKEKVMTVRTEVYSRVVGYYRPIQDWNEGKREEFKERRYLKIKEEKK